MNHPILTRVLVLEKLGSTVEPPKLSKNSLWKRSTDLLKTRSISFISFLLGRFTRAFLLQDRSGRSRKKSHGKSLTIIDLENVMCYGATDLGIHPFRCPKNFKSGCYTKGPWSILGSTPSLGKGFSTLYRWIFRKNLPKWIETTILSCLLYAVWTMKKT